MLKEQVMADNRILSNYIKRILKNAIEKESVWKVIEQTETEIKSGKCTVVKSKAEQDACLDSL